MRFLLISYYKKPGGQIDEVLSVANKVRNGDWQTASVILDFKEQKVLKATADGVAIPKDWNRIVLYYYTHYKKTVERLFIENGYTVVQDEEVNTPIE